MKETNKLPVGVTRTSDIPLIAYLKFKGYSVKQIVKVSPFKAEFVFEDVAQDVIDDFNQDRALVEPRLYAAIMRQQTYAAKMSLK